MKKFLGVEATTFADAAQAEKYLRTNGADLIVADYSMPEMTGIELIGRVRAGGPNQATPIIVVTSSAFESLKGKIMLAGAQDFLTKPVSPQDSKVRVLDHRARRSASRKPDALRQSSVRCSPRPRHIDLG